MNILIAPDNKVMAPTCALLNSLRSNNPDQEIVVYLLWCDLLEENLKTLQDFGFDLGLDMVPIRLDPLPVNRLFDRLPRNRLTASTLLRCFIGQSLPDSLDRILYLDIDIVLVGPIDELYATQLHQKIAGVVLNPGLDHLEKFGLSANRCFNAGVLLIDMNMWREHDLDDKLQSFLAEYAEDCLYLDQCALNVVLYGKTLTLDNRWNVMGCLEDDSEFTNVSIIHFAGDIKPWEQPESHPYGIHYCNYSRATPWPTPYRYQHLRRENPVNSRADQG